LGTVVGLSGVLRTWLQPTLELVRPLPASAIVLVAIAFVDGIILVSNALLGLVERRALRWKQT
jgi:ABC-type nitrate/sulfonate/bicarbonate transport system permease component